MAAWTWIRTGIGSAVFAGGVLAACGAPNAPGVAEPAPPILGETLAEASANAALYLPGCLEEYRDGRGGGMSRAAAGGDVRAMACLWSRYGRDADVGVEFGYMLFRATGEKPYGFDVLVRNSTHFDAAYAIISAHRASSFLTEIPLLENGGCYPFDEPAQKVLALADRSVVSEMVCSEKLNRRRR